MKRWLIVVSLVLWFAPVEEANAQFYGGEWDAYMTIQCEKEYVAKSQIKNTLICHYWAFEDYGNLYGSPVPAEINKMGAYTAIWSRPYVQPSAPMIPTDAIGKEYIIPRLPYKQDHWVDCVTDQDVYARIVAEGHLQHHSGFVYSETVSAGLAEGRVNMSLCVNRQAKADHDFTEGDIYVFPTPDCSGPFVATNDPNDIPPGHSFTQFDDEEDSCETKKPKKAVFEAWEFMGCVFGGSVGQFILEFESDGATSYEVEFAVVPGAFAAHTQTTNVYAIVSGGSTISNNWRVRGVNAGGHGPWSDEITTPCVCESGGGGQMN